MIKTTTLPLRKARTDTFDLQVLKDKVPYPLTDCQLTIVVKSAQSPEGGALITKTIGSGIEITDSLNGKFRVTFPVADKASLNAGGRYFWETKMILANGDTITPENLEGAVSVETSILN